MQAYSIDVRPEQSGNNGTTHDAEPLPLGIFGLEDGAAAVVRVRAVARRPDAGAAAFWSFDLRLKRAGGRVLVVGDFDTVRVTSDDDAMSGAAVAPFTGERGAGVKVSGMAGVPINWAVQIEGVALAD